MTLAALLLVSIFCSSSPAATWHWLVLQVATSTKAAETSAAQDQGTATPPAQNSSVPSPTPSSATKPPKTSSAKTPSTAAKPRTRKKKALPTGCSTATSTSQAASGPTSTATTPAATGTTSGTSSPCPPPKVIVRQGGTSEPSIELAGGAAGGRTADQRNTANQMLDATETNLKKIAGHQLTTDQQGMVTQIQQFMDQSKTAVKDGDLERARTLAWKAQLLSEELVKPEE